MGCLSRETFEIRVKAIEFLTKNNQGKDIKEIAKFIFPDELQNIDLKRKIYSSLQRLSKLKHLRCDDYLWYAEDSAAEYLEYLRNNEKFLVRNNYM